MSEGKKKEEPNGFTCKCGKEHIYPAYVYSHWRERLDHTCDVCNSVHAIIMGSARLVKAGKKVTP